MKVLMKTRTLREGVSSIFQAFFLCSTRERPPHSLTRGDSLLGVITLYHRDGQRDKEHSA